MAVGPGPQTLRQRLTLTVSLFSYRIPVDDGAAPNPYWGVCSLAICKPRIRKAARLNDWIVGTGSANSPIGDISSMVVYAMLVTRRVTMRDYDRIARTELPGKLPDWESSDFRCRVGDSIYDFSTTPPTVRRSVHDERNRAKDLGGEYVLLSDHFYYFGDRPVELPVELRGIVKTNQGHKRIREEATIDEFVSWLESLGAAAGQPLGAPQCKDLERRCFLDDQDDA